MGKGRTYEHSLARSLDDVTGPEVWLTTAGHSGNATYDDCDLVVTVNPRLRLRTEPAQYNIEVKKRQGQAGRRVSDAVDGSRADESGKAELIRLVADTPSWADAVVALKLTYRKLLVVPADVLLAHLGVTHEDVPDVSVPPTLQSVFDVFEPRLTQGDNVSMVKPEGGAWPSAQASRPDEVVLADRLSLPYEYDDEEEDDD